MRLPFQCSTPACRDDPVRRARPQRRWVAAAALLMLAACGGGGGDGGTAGPTGVTPPPVAPPVSPPVVPPVVPPVEPPVEPPADVCTLPEYPPLPENMVDVRAFGAVPDDELDDTAAIQAAIRSLSPGQWLRFPAGVYLHDARLLVDVPGAVLWSDGARLHATNPNDMAVMLAADGASIFNFTLTAVTGQRLYAPWHARIAVYDENRSQPLRNNVIGGNRVLNGAEAGTPEANSASAAGIYVDFAEDFIVAGNEVLRSLADGIQVTGGSRNGRVIFNTVRESGDDMISMVSYMGEGDWKLDTAASLNAALGSARDRLLVRNVVVAENELSGAYWGRGITVVGGEDITIRNNRILGTAVGAGILIGREASYVTWGVNNVLVQDNSIGQVQTLPPAYLPVGLDPRDFAVSGHGAVEIHSFVFQDEMALPGLFAALSVQNVRVARTVIDQSRFYGVRLGEGTGQISTLAGALEDGSPISRTVTGGVVRRVDLSELSMTGIPGLALDILADTSEADNVFCESLSLEGGAVSHPRCGGARPAVTGSSLRCNP